MTNLNTDVCHSLISHMISLNSTTSLIFIYTVALVLYFTYFISLIVLLTNSQWLLVHIFTLDTLHCNSQGYYTAISIKLGKICCCTISPWWVVHNFCPAKRTRLLSVKPRGNTGLTEDVTTVEENWCFIFIVADWALAARCL